MSKSISEVPTSFILREKTLEQITEWLEDFLRGRNVDVPLPHTYRSYADFLGAAVAGCKEEEREVVCKLGDAAFNLLLRMQTSPEFIDFDLVGEILRILEVVPTKDPGRVACLLDIMRNSPNYKGFRESPSPGHEDCHRLILFALANQIPPDIPHGSKEFLEWESSLVEEIKDERYTIAAFCAICQLSVERAIGHFQTTWKVLKENQITPVNFIFGFAYRLDEDLNLWRKLVEQIQDMDDHDEILTELREAAEDLEYTSVAEIFNTDISIPNRNP